MKTILIYVAVGITALTLLTDQAHAQGRRGGRGRFDDQSENNRNQQAEQQAANSPGVITDLNAFSITVKQGAQSAPVNYRVTMNCPITLDGQPANIAALKTGMTVQVTPGLDKTYAAAIAATAPVAAPVQPQPTNDAPVAPVASAPAPRTPSASFTPYGRPINQYNP